MTIVDALATSMWQEVTGVVDAFLIIYKTEVV